MTKKLTELFDLPSTDDGFDIDSSDEEYLPEPEISEITTNTASVLEKIDAALPAVRGLETTDAEMDEIARMALDSYQQLFDLGMNIEAKVASEILSSASQFLGHAITARNAKVNKKIKMIEMQLKKARLDKEIAAASGVDETSTGMVIDRNELLEQILQQAKGNAGDGKTE